jgi:YidC/Oxa1 family membrane protein insertase
MADKLNLLIFILLTLAILVSWPHIAAYVFPPAHHPAMNIESRQIMAVPRPGSADMMTTARLRARTIVLRETPRIAIETPKLVGSINLKGARIDDVVLPGYKESIDKNAPPVRLYSPSGTPQAHFAGFGWTGEGVRTPDDNSVWTAEGTTLSPGAPVTLSWDNGQGQSFRIRLTIDADYMIAAEQSVANAGTGPVAVRPFAYISRDGVSKDPSSWTMHTGPIGVFDGAANYKVDYKDLDEDGSRNFSGTNGWLGFTDHYWLSALVPDQKHCFQAAFRTGGDKQYQADLTSAPSTVPPGKRVSQTTRLFVGAKETQTLRDYADAGVPMLDYAIDWGWFRWFELPIFNLLHWLFAHVRNFGLAIICLTFIVRGMMYPLVRRQYLSMANMRSLQPKMKAIQERYKDDKPKQQQEIMALYKAEKVNPLGSLLPLLIQVPIFFALYKVLQLDIGMRHEPFMLWIKDLSAPDPLHIVNGFGLLDFAPPAFMAVGVLAVLLGISLWLQSRLNPIPMEGTQKQMAGIIPWVAMVFSASFAAGLLVYSITSNLITIAQQRWLHWRYAQVQ